MGLAFGVLGALEVRRDGEPLPLPSARQRTVLAALLVHVGRPVPVDALVEAAWADLPPARPRAALQTVVSRLRGVLGAAAVRGGPAGYRLAVPQAALDAARFDALLARAAVAPAREALELLDAALALWRGRAYAEFAGHDFARAEAVRLDELRLAAVEDRAALLLELGDPPAAVAALEPFCGEHPLRDRARGLLMTALYGTGRATDALAQYRDHRRHLAEELGLEPPPTLRELEQRILRHEVPAPPRPSAPPWLVTDAAFLGREDDLRALVAAVTAQRLVTITGVGGVGKTRLAAEALPALTARLGLPATVVELAGVTAAQVEVAIASALAVGPTGGDVGGVVREYLSITRLLLVLDNCEHVLGGVQRFVGDVLRRCAGVRVLATSRQRIGLTAEQVLPLAPLDEPAASRLFADRARRVRPTFALPAVAPAVTEVCRLLDGLPLAIELAATRAATLGVDPLRARLDGALDLLAGDDRSLRATLDWSYELLGERERALLAALAVFEAEFDLDAAEQVGVPLGCVPVAATLSGLVDASLVTARPAAGELRYRLLVIVRGFARERLTASGAERDVRRAHARWVRWLAQQAAGAVVGHAGAAAWSRLEGATANVRAACDWALDAGEGALAGEITGPLVLAAVHRRLPPELLDVVHRAARDPAAPVLARAGAAFAAMWQGDLGAAERAARVELASARTVDERYLTLSTLSVVTLYRGDHEAARRWSRELLAVDALAPARRSSAHATLALVACYGGEGSAARRHLADAEAAAEAAGSDAYRSFTAYAAAEVTAAEDLPAAVPLLVAAARDAGRVGAEFPAGLATTALVAALTRLGRGIEARDLVGPLLDRWLRLGTWPQLWTTLRIVAELLVRHDRPEPAVLLLAAADRAPTAPAVTGEDRERCARLIATARARVGPRALDELDALAAVLPRAQVVDRARAAVSDL
ncbi:MAG TPA: BTAD domain-containing putative transcriptional regulator [Pseudonocardia sp.]|nr:BTAD domain-containing putative transcriptional regulator [Pseudonocardia sp.]